MTEKKKMGAGLVLSVITVLVTVAGLVHDELQNKLFCKNYWY